MGVTRRKLANVLCAFKCPSNVSWPQFNELSINRAYLRLQCTCNYRFSTRIDWETRPTPPPLSLPLFPFPAAFHSTLLSDINVGNWHSLPLLPLPVSSADTDSDSAERTRTYDSQFYTSSVWGTGQNNKQKQRECSTTNCAYPVV